MTGYTPRRGSAWINQIFTKSAVARRGGPVRRSIASITKHASLRTAYAAATARGWLIVQIKSDWHFYDADLLIQRIDGISGRSSPLMAL